MKPQAAVAKSLAVLSKSRSPHSLSQSIELFAVDSKSLFRPISPQLPTSQSTVSVPSTVFGSAVSKSQDVSSSDKSNFFPPPQYTALEALGRPTLEAVTVSDRVDAESAVMAPALMGPTTEEVPGGQLVLDENPLSRTRSSVVFRVQNKPRVVVKYQVQCAGFLLAVHPLVREYHVLTKIKSLGVAPTPLAVSLPSELPLQATPKTNFDMTPEERADCINFGSYVRFLVMERVGVSMYHLSGLFPAGMVPSKLVLTLAVQTIRNLQQLHESARIVHNDIHWGNVAFPDKVVEDPRVFLIDFGRSFSIPEFRIPLTLRAPFQSANVHMSPWEIAGYHPGPRDDVYRAIFMAIGLLGGKSFMKYHAALSEYPRSAFDTKSSPETLLAPLRAVLTVPQLDHLSKALTSVLQVGGPQMPVNYAEILKHLAEAD